MISVGEKAGQKKRRKVWFRTLVYLGAAFIIILLGSQAAVDIAKAGASLSRAKNLENAVFRRFNQVRKQHGLKPLKEENNLARIAASHSCDMLKKDYFNHVSPSGATPKMRILNQHPAKIYAWGENIFTSSGFQITNRNMARKMLEAWMKSPGHRENILRKNFTHTGVGICRASDEIRATQAFAKLK